jgi:hypothetical protein
MFPELSAEAARLAGVTLTIVMQVASPATSLRRRHNERIVSKRTHLEHTPPRAVRAPHGTPLGASDARPRRSPKSLPVQVSPCSNRRIGVGVSPREPESHHDDSRQPGGQHRDRSQEGSTHHLSRAGILALRHGGTIVLVPAWWGRMRASLRPSAASWAPSGRHCSSPERGRAIRAWHAACGCRAADRPLTAR